MYAENFSKMSTEDRTRLGLKHVRDHFEPVLAKNGPFPYGKWSHKTIRKVKRCVPDPTSVAELHLAEGQRLWASDTRTGSKLFFTYTVEEMRKEQAKTNNRLRDRYCCLSEEDWIHPVFDVDNYIPLAEKNQGNDEEWQNRQRRQLIKSIVSVFQEWAREELGLTLLDTDFALSDSSRINAILF